MKTIGGFEAIRAYNHNLVLWAGETLARLWNTEIQAEARLCATMCVVRTPLHWSWFLKPGSTVEDARSDGRINGRVNAAVYAHSAVQAQFVFYQDSIYVRLSAQVRPRKHTGCGLENNMRSVVGTNATVNDALIGATTEPGEPGYLVASVWYAHVAVTGTLGDPGLQHQSGLLEAWPLPAGADTGAHFYTPSVVEVTTSGGRVSRNIATAFFLAAFSALHGRVPPSKPATTCVHTLSTGLATNNRLPQTRRQALPCSQQRLRSTECLLPNVHWHSGRGVGELSPQRCLKLTCHHSESDAATALPRLLCSHQGTSDKCLLFPQALLLTLL